MTWQEDRRFCSAVAGVLQHEGGYVDDPKDPGGRTKYGISQRAYPDLDIPNLTVAHAKDIYYQDYWKRSGVWRLKNPRVQAAVFDFAVNSGAFRAVKILQTAYNAVRSSRARLLMTDGVLGPVTARKVNALGPTISVCLFYAFTALRAVFYISLDNRRFVRGWLSRAFNA